MTYIPSYIFGFIIASCSYILYQNYMNGYPSLVTVPDRRYDYIIVGAGTAGCVLAARLTEDPNTKVLLIEAGEQMNFFTKIPLTPTAAQLGPYDWSVRTTPQKYSSFGLINQTQIIPRGKGLGGSGQINFLMHGFGRPKDYEKWRELGLHSWCYDELKPYFLKAFGTIQSEFDSRLLEWRKHVLEMQAPMKLTQLDDRNELMQVFKEASKLRSHSKVLFRKPTATVHAGRRWSTLDAYLRPAMNRHNLHVLTKSVGVSIRFKNKMASSLYIIQNGRQFNNIFVNNEIIITAGAIKSPQVLISSGIGPRKILEKHKIPIVAINEQVGKNVHDHMNMPVYVSIKQPISVTLAKIFTFSTLWDYVWKNEGLLAFPPLAGIEYIDDSALMLFSLGTANERLLRGVSNYKSKMFKEVFRHHNSSSTKEGFMFLASCALPRSRGDVTLRDISITVPPAVNPNYLHHEYDVKCIIKGIRRAERLVSSPPFRDIGAVIQWPKPERCMTFWNMDKKVRKKPTFRFKDRRTNIRTHPSPSDSYLECIIREAAVTGHHIGGSCSGGTVVDELFRLKSVKGVRIVDASVLPSPLSLYPNSVVVSLAEKAADLIKNENIHF